jgi:solute carrier family 36 (proton-coupled amino acid transporter)
MDPKGISTILGFAVYSFEGIGVVMPILKDTKDKSRFNEILLAALVTVGTVYVVFGIICVSAYGNTMTSPFITEMLPPNNYIVIIIKFAFLVNVICSYPLVIKPCNDILENTLYGSIQLSEEPTDIEIA